MPRCYQKTSENPLFLQKSNTSNTKKQNTFVTKRRDKPPPLSVYTSCKK
nr:MAG TPA: hypothetical protein [Caudoviricetes sp.]